MGIVLKTVSSAQSEGAPLEVGQRAGEVRGLVMLVANVLQGVIVRGGSTPGSSEQDVAIERWLYDQGKR